MDKLSSGLRQVFHPDRIQDDAFSTMHEKANMIFAAFAEISHFFA